MRKPWGVGRKRHFYGAPVEEGASGIDNWEGQYDFPTLPQFDDACGLSLREAVEQIGVVF